MKRVEEGVDYIVVTKNLKVFISGQVEIPASHSIIAEKLINPSPAEEKKMKEALASQAKKKVSVSGRIIQVRNELLVYPSTVFVHLLFTPLFYNNQHCMVLLQGC
jgi:hypothetical protein